MIKINHQILFLIIAFAGLFHQKCLAGINENPDSASNPVLVKSRNGITMYENWIQHSDNKKTREISFVFQVNAPVDSVFKLIRDVDYTSTWNKNVRNSEMIADSGEVWFAYIRYAIPWPFNDQDCVLESRVVRQTRNGFRMEFSSVSLETRPALKGVERMQKVNGKWEVYQKDGRTYVRYAVSTQPSKVPNWITDPFVSDAFLSSFESFKKVLEK